MARIRSAVVGLAFVTLWGCGEGRQANYDLVIAGGRVMDPASTRSSTLGFAAAASRRSRTLHFRAHGSSTPAIMWWPPASSIFTSTVRWNSPTR